MLIQSSTTGKVFEVAQGTLYDKNAYYEITPEELTAKQTANAPKPIAKPEPKPRAKKKPVKKTTKTAKKKTAK